MLDFITVGMHNARRTIVDLIVGHAKENRLVGVRLYYTRYSITSPQMRAES